MSVNLVSSTDFSLFPGDYNAIHGNSLKSVVLQLVCATYRLKSVLLTEKSVLLTD